MITYVIRLIQRNIARLPMKAILKMPSSDYCHLNIYTNSVGAQVFATGSIQWSWGLDDYETNASVLVGPSRVSQKARQLTHNVLRTFSGKQTAALLFVN